MIAVDRNGMKVRDSTDLNGLAVMGEAVADPPELDDTFAPPLLPCPQLALLGDCEVRLRKGL